MNLIPDTQLSGKGYSVRNCEVDTSEVEGVRFCFTTFFLHVCIMAPPVEGTLSQVLLVRRALNLKAKSEDNE